MVCRRMARLIDEGGGKVSASPGEVSFLSSQLAPSSPDDDHERLKIDVVQK